MRRLRRERSGHRGLTGRNCGSQRLKLGAGSQGVTTIPPLIELPLATANAMRRHWRPMVAVCLVASVFAWTNWFYSAEKRFDRLTEDVLSSGDWFVQTELMDAVKARSGGVTRRASCGRVCVLEIEAGASKFDEEPYQHWGASVSVTYRPILDKLDRATWLPPSIRWELVSWDWSVTSGNYHPAPPVIDYRNGKWDELVSGRKIPADSVYVPLLRQVRKTMEKHLSQQDLPISRRPSSESE